MAEKGKPREQQVFIPAKPHPQLTDAIILALDALMAKTHGEAYTNPTRSRGSSGGGESQGSAESGERNEPKDSD